jgi:hypothetical protein
VPSSQTSGKPMSAPIMLPEVELILDRNSAYINSRR